MKRRSIEELRNELKKVEKEFMQVKMEIETLNEELKLAKEKQKELRQRRHLLRCIIGSRKGKKCPALKIWNGIYRCYARRGLAVAPDRERMYAYYCYKCSFKEDQIKVRLLTWHLGDRG